LQIRLHEQKARKSIQIREIFIPKRV
jgi:hypothetical protein